MKFNYMKNCIFMVSIITALPTFGMAIHGQSKKEIVNPFLDGISYGPFKQDITRLTKQLNSVESLATTKEKIAVLKSIVDEIYELRPNVDGTEIKTNFSSALLTTKTELIQNPQDLKKSFAQPKIKRAIDPFMVEYSSVSKARVSFRNACLKGTQPKEACALAELFNQTLIKLKKVLSQV